MRPSGAPRQRTSAPAVHLQSRPVCGRSSPAQRERQAAHGRGGDHRGRSWSTHGPMTLLPFARDLEPPAQRLCAWSGRRDSNPRPSPWQGSVLTGASLDESPGQALCRPAPQAARTQIAAQERRSRSSVAPCDGGCRQLPPGSTTNLMRAREHGDIPAAHVEVITGAEALENPPAATPRTKLAGPDPGNVPDRRAQRSGRVHSQRERGRPLRRVPLAHQRPGDPRTASARYAPRAALASLRTLDLGGGVVGEDRHNLARRPSASLTACIG